MGDLDPSPVSAPSWLCDLCQQSLSFPRPQLPHPKKNGTGPFCATTPCHSWMFCEVKARKGMHIREESFPVQRAGRQLSPSPTHSHPRITSLLTKSFRFPLRPPGYQIARRPPRQSNSQNPKKFQVNSLSFQLPTGQPQFRQRGPLPLASVPRGPSCKQVPSHP